MKARNRKREALEKKEAGREKTKKPEKREPKEWSLRKRKV